MNIQRILMICLFGVGLAIGEAVLDLGHVREVNVLKSSANYLVSQDLFGSWIVWNMATKAQAFSGRSDLSDKARFDLRNGILAMQAASGFDIYTLPNPTPVHVAADSLDSVSLTSDGAYAFSGTRSRLRIWKRTGDAVQNLQGSFAGCTIAMDSVRAYVAVPGIDSISIFSVPAWTPVGSVRFAGTFNGWLIEGKRFQTRQGTIVRTYDKTGKMIAIQDIPDLANLGGWGNYFWSQPGGIAYRVDIFRVGESIQPILSLLTGVNTTLAAFEGRLAIYNPYWDTLKVCEFGQDSVQVLQETAVGPQITAVSIAYDGMRFTATRNGVVGYALPGKPSQPLNYGSLRSLTGDSSGRFAVATSSGKILTLALRNGTAEKKDSLPCNSSLIKMSSDGRILAAMASTFEYQYSPDRSIFVYDLRNHSLLRKWEYAVSDSSVPVDFDLSRDGSALSMRFSSYSYRTSSLVFSAAVYDISTGTAKFQIPDGPNKAPRLSPRGNLAALDYDSIVKLYEDGRLVNAFSGTTGGWYNDSQMVYNKTQFITDLFSRRFKQWQATYLADKEGRLDSSLRFSQEFSDFMEITDSEAVSRDYPNQRNWLFSLRSGAKLFDTDIQLRSLASNPATFVGTDYVAYQDYGSLKLINWRQNPFSIGIRRQVIPNRGSASGNAIARAGEEIILDMKVDAGMRVEAAAYSLRGERLGLAFLGKSTSERFRSAVSLTTLLGKRNLAGGTFIVAALADGRKIAVTKVTSLDW